jgi:hypothetical protein
VTVIALGCPIVPTANIHTLKARDLHKRRRLGAKSLEIQVLWLGLRKKEYCGKANAVKPQEGGGNPGLEQAWGQYSWSALRGRRNQRWLTSLVGKVPGTGSYLCVSKARVITLA